MVDKEKAEQKARKKAKEKAEEKETLKLPELCLMSWTMKPSLKKLV